VVAGEEVSNYMWIYIAFHFFPSNNISNKETKCKVVHWPALAMYIWFQQLVALVVKCLLKLMQVTCRVIFAMFLIQSL
jgi:hypothetical protein